MGLPQEWPRHLPGQLTQPISTRMNARPPKMSRHLPNQTPLVTFRNLPASVTRGVIIRHTWGDVAVQGHHFSLLIVLRRALLPTAYRAPRVSSGSGGRAPHLWCSFAFRVSPRGCDLHLPVDRFGAASLVAYVVAVCLHRLTI